MCAAMSTCHSFTKYLKTMINGHGDDSYHYQQKILSNFSSNVYPQVDHTGLKSRLRCCLSGIANYPEPEPFGLESTYARSYHLPEGSLCMTNGATEAIYLIAQAFRGSRTAVLQPTFSEYADACRMHGHQLTSFYTLDRIPDDVRLVWICNPNNPTGIAHDYERLVELIEQHPQVMFIIDQSYEYFTLKKLLSPLEGVGFPNVILIHSMTKRYAIPGLRLGYVTARPELMDHLRAFRMPWSVNHLAIEAGQYIFDNELPRKHPLPEYLEECARLRAKLQALGGLEVWPTDTHFMLVYLRSGKASALKDYLANEHGLLIRDASNFEGLSPGFFRVCTQTPAENDRLVEAIGLWFAQ